MSKSDSDRFIEHLKELGEDFVKEVTIFKSAKDANEIARSYLAVLKLVSSLELMSRRLNEAKRVELMSEVNMMMNEVSVPVKEVKQYLERMALVRSTMNKQSSN